MPHPVFRIIRLPALLCTLALAGCMFASPPQPEPETPPTPLAAFMIAHEPGDTATVHDPDYGGDVQVTIQETFISATGEECRRASLVSRQQEAEMAVICRKEGGRWVMGARIWGQGIR